MKHPIPALALALLTGCGGGTDPSVQDPTATDSSNHAAAATIDLAGHDLPLLLIPPEKQLTDGQEPTIVWKDETGTLEIRAGDHFGLMIREEPADIPRLKAALERDLVQENSLLRETPELLTYRSAFPDDPSLVFLHFYKVVNAGDRVFVIEDVKDQTFNQQDIERMLGAISPKPPA